MYHTWARRGSWQVCHWPSEFVLGNTYWKCQEVVLPQAIGLFLRDGNRAFWFMPIISLGMLRQENSMKYSPVNSRLQIQASLDYSVISGVQINEQMDKKERIQPFWMMSSEFVSSWCTGLGVSRLTGVRALSWLNTGKNLKGLHSHMYELIFIYLDGCMHFHTCRKVGSGSICNSVHVQFRVECAGVGNL